MIEPLEDRRLLAAEVLSGSQGTIAFGPQPLAMNSVAVSVADAVITEGNSGTAILSFSVNLSGPTAQQVTVDIETDNSSAADAADPLQVRRLVSGLTNPVYLTTAPGEPETLFVVEQDGLIKRVDRDTGAVSTTSFLSVDNLRTGGERGLLGLAFHPQYQTNRLLYVYTTDSGGDTSIRQFKANPDGMTADVNSSKRILEFDQPFGNHNGGWIDFGPDGYLYIASGDGGSGNDPGNNAQTITDNLLGKILRIDVDGDDFPADAHRNYAIPPANPFVGVAGDDEIWSFGLRNPWRNSFDRETGDLLIADVGQTLIEEINFQPASSVGGENYGWRDREGTIATPSVGGPKPAGAIDPIYEYAHGTGPTEGFSVTGGYVYRGPIEELRGQYFFADYVRNRVWSIRPSGDDPSNFDATNFTDFTDWTPLLNPDQGQVANISSFGEDSEGNLYIIDRGGEVFVFTGSGADYIPNAQQLSFNSGETSKRFEVEIIGDRLPEINEQVQAVVLSAVGATIDDGSAIGIIQNDDAAKVIDVAIGDGSASRSRLDQIALTFDSDVELDESGTSAFEIVNRNTGESVNLSRQISASSGRTVVTLQFLDGPSVESQSGAVRSLVDANYQLTIDASKVSIGGVLLDGNGDSTAGDDFFFGESSSDLFFRLFGDVDGDRDVDGLDLGGFGQAFLKTVGEDGYSEAVDFDADGDVDGLDLGAFGQRFLQTMPFVD